MKPRLLIISQTIRRDLHVPLSNLNHFEVIHLYQAASYGDMLPADFKSPRAIQFSGVLDLYKKIKESKPAILQLPEPSANQLSFLAGLIGLVYWFFYRPKIVVPFFENRPFGQKFGWLKFLLVVALTRRIRRIASMLIVLNKGAARNLLSIGVEREKIVSLMWGSWGINTAEFKPGPSKRNNEILFLGRVSKAKGVLNLLDAYRIVKEKRPEVTLTIAGPAGDALTAVKDSGANYIGLVKNSDTPRLLAQATVVAMPSLTTQEWEEQVGMVGLQALACGTCLVTTRSGAIPEYFKSGEGCLIVRQNNPQELAEALLNFLDNPKYRIEQERKGVAYIAKNYEFKSQLNKIEAKLKALID